MVLQSVLETVKLSFLYFATAFVAGAMLGAIRVMIFQPYMGARYAELLEMPIMLIWIWQAAHLTVWQLDSRQNLKQVSSTAVWIGILSTLFLILAELTGTAIRQRNWSRVVYHYLADRDLVSGSVFGLAVLTYAVMPWYIWNLQEQNEEPAVEEIKVDEGEDYCNR